MFKITFEFHGQLLRLAGAETRTLSFDAPVSLAEALSQLGEDVPELDAMLARCACAIGERLVLRRERLDADCRIALLPPVGGG
ncbi:MAG TPA: MoaD/ThiS family protein [Solimonas sp.]|jgi:molybdopterin synthase sulfur carrier subunit|nr:MoaD/ThiS family protein [Solimonas sp.]